MPRLSRPDPPGLPVVVSRAAALASGLTSGEIKYRVQSGRWSVVGPGQYLRQQALREQAAQSDPFEAARIAHALAALTAARRLTGATVAYGSAAIVHGMALASGIPAHRELVVPPGGHEGIRAGVRVRRSVVDPNDIVIINDARVTSPARTWVDIARTSDLADALSSGDSALRRSLCTSDELGRAASHQEHRRGARRVTAALPLLSPLRENPLESLSVARFVEWDLPLPECQVEIWDDEGFVARVDFLWRDVAIIGEADGRMKYNDLRVLYEEKRREDRLRALGYTVVRWDWTDLTRVAKAHRLRARFVSLFHADPRTPASPTGIGH